MKTSLRFISLISILILSACGEITSQTQTPDPSASGSGGRGNTAVILSASFTDSVGSLGIIPIAAPRTPSRNAQITHSDAIVRSFGNQLYVVNRLGADNIEIVDPSDFNVIKQCSVGRGTNPQDIVVTAFNKAFVSLHQPEQNASTDLTVDDLLLIDPSASTCNAFITRAIDLTSLSTDDGDRFARASSMVVVGDHLYVALQDLPGNLSQPADQPGKVAVVNTNTGDVIQSITLSGRNPVSMTYSPETRRIYIGNVDNFYTTSSLGGIEVVNPETNQSEGFLVSKADLGGSPADLEVTGSKGLVAVGVFDSVNSIYNTKVVSFNLDPSQPAAITQVYQSAGYIQDIAIDENGNLLVGDQDPHVNGILFVNPSTNAIIDGPINMGAPPSSITFVQR